MVFLGLPPAGRVTQQAPAPPLNLSPLTCKIALVAPPPQWSCWEHEHFPPEPCPFSCSLPKACNEQSRNNHISCWWWLYAVLCVFIWPARSRPQLAIAKYTIRSRNLSEWFRDHNYCGPEPGLEPRLSDSTAMLTTPYFAQYKSSCIRP